MKTLWQLNLEEITLDRMAVRFFFSSRRKGDSRGLPDTPPGATPEGMPGLVVSDLILSGTGAEPEGLPNSCGAGTFGARRTNSGGFAFICAASEDELDLSPAAAVGVVVPKEVATNGQCRITEQRTILFLI